MAEITKITAPMVPKENMGPKLRPITDQAFDLTAPGKVHEATQEGKAAERKSESQNLLKDSMGRAAVMPLLKNASDMSQVFKKIAFLVEMGVSASDVTSDAQVRELLESLFVSPKDFAKVLMEQDNSTILFKGGAFDALRDILSKFGDYPKIKDAIANLLKTFDQNVNTQNSIKTILYNCNNLLDYMFSKDRAQFSDYLQGLAEMLLPKEEAAKFMMGQPQTQNAGQTDQQQAAQTQNAGQTGQQQAAQTQNAGQTDQQQAAQTQNAGQQISQAQNQGQAAQPQNTQQSQAENPQQSQITPQTQTEGQPAAQPNTETSGAPKEAAGDTSMPQTANQAQTQAGEKAQTAGQPPQVTGNAAEQARQAQTPDQARQVEVQPQLDHKEMAQMLKSNLLPLLGEIVVKYNQSPHIRDVVMVVVHNIVRVDQGTPESLQAAVSKLAKELEQVANLPPGFERNLMEAVRNNIEHVKNAPNTVISKLTDIIEQTLKSPDSNPAILRQAENMLISMLQNQSSMMDLIHFMLPLETPQGQVFTELYVDPETGEKAGKQKGQGRKIFLTVESEEHGSFELSFLETDEHIDFAMWCPDPLVKPLSGLKRQFSDIMQSHGYTMNQFKVDQLKAPHSVAEVFPRLLEKKVGIDVQA